MAGSSGCHHHGSLLPRPAPSAAQPVRLGLIQLEMSDLALSLDTEGGGHESEGPQGRLFFFQGPGKRGDTGFPWVTARHAVPKPTRPTARLQLLTQENAAHGVYELIAFATCMVFPLNALPAAA